MDKKIWIVKCPMCGNKWKYANDQLTVAPKYLYCRKCERIQAEMGRIATRPLRYHGDGEK